MISVVQRVLMLTLFLGGLSSAFAAPGGHGHHHGHPAGGGGEAPAPAANQDRPGDGASVRSCPPAPGGPCCCHSLAAAPGTVKTFVVDASGSTLALTMRAASAKFPHPSQPLLAPGALDAARARAPPISSWSSLQ